MKHTKRLCLKIGLIIFMLTVLTVGSSLAEVKKTESIKYSPSPDFFPILPWDAQHHWKGTLVREHGLDTIAECNFTIGGFVLPEDLPLCEKLGIKAIVITRRQWKLVKKKGWKKLSDEQIDEAVKKIIEEAGNSKAILGYFIVDEPVASDFPALAVAVRAVKKYAPGKLAYINLNPGPPSKKRLNSHIVHLAGGYKDIKSWKDYLEKFINIVKPQMVSYDNYDVMYSYDLKEKEKTEHYFRDLMDAYDIIVHKHKLPFWNIVCSKQIRPHTTIPTLANLRLQAYTTLAAGGRGISWFNYYWSYNSQSPIDNTYGKTLTWRYLQQVNREIATLGPVMNRLKSTGVYFSDSALKLCPDYFKPLPGRLVNNVISQDVPDYKENHNIPEMSHPPVMIGEFISDDGTNYLMVVNLSLKRSTRLKLKTIMAYKNKKVITEEQKMSIISAEGGTIIPFDNLRGHWIAPGQGLLLKLSTDRWYFPKKAYWIWYDMLDPIEDDIPTAHPTIVARKEFNCNQKPEKAELIVSVNYSYKLYFNGKLLGKNVYRRDDITPYDITKLIKKGKNVIAVSAKCKRKWYAGIYAEAILKTNKGDRYIISDKTWLVSTKADKGWETLNFKPGDDWINAKEKGKPEDIHSIPGGKMRVKR